MLRHEHGGEAEADGDGGQVPGPQEIGGRGRRPADRDRSASPLACVDTAQKVVSLDCISTFPEANIKARDKYDLGPINLVLLYGVPTGGPAAASVIIGPVPYDKATYESGGGVVDISYAAESRRST